MEKFVIGDIVELKSGGPKMTVVDPEYGDEIQCTWFDGKKQGFGNFPPEALKKVKED